MTAPTPVAPAAPMEAPRLPAGLDTPDLVIDLDVVERNAARLGGALAARGIALRPHVKTHKSVALAGLQLGAGAKGITVGNLGEAEVFAAGDIDDLFIAYPIWVEGPKAAWLRDLMSANRSGSSAQARRPRSSPPRSTRSTRSGRGPT